MQTAQIAGLCTWLLASPFALVYCSREIVLAGFSHLLGPGELEVGAAVSRVEVPLLGEMRDMTALEAYKRLNRYTRLVRSWHTAA
jgi:hypothetical protein